MPPIKTSYSGNLLWSRNPHNNRQPAEGNFSSVKRSSSLKAIAYQSMFASSCVQTAECMTADGFIIGLSWNYKHHESVWFGSVATAECHIPLKKKKKMQPLAGRHRQFPSSCFGEDEWIIIVTVYWLNGTTAWLHQKILNHPWFGM